MVTEIFTNTHKPARKAARTLMNEVIHEKISVISRYDRRKGQTAPVKLRWQGTDRMITKVGFHYTKREGRKLLHCFTVTDGQLAYYLSLDTETLSWMLEEVSDGTAN